MTALIIVSCDSSDTVSTTAPDVTTDAPALTTAAGTTAGTTTAAAVTTSAPVTSAPSSEFDETSIVLSFGAISDVHITGNATETEKFNSALSQLKKYAAKHDKDGLDAVAIAGDIADTGLTSQVKIFSDIVKKSKIETVMLTTGNHDVHGENKKAHLSDYISVMGEKYFEVDVDKSMLDKGARHCVVDGYHFFFIEPAKYGDNCPYDGEVIRWLNSSLEKITKEDPNAYVFLFTHPMLYNTCYGSTLSDGFWYTNSLTPTLNKYPQVITFSGHLHFPVNDEKSIMQTRFTSLGCGSVRYLAVERGFSNMSSATVPKDAHSVSSGLLVQVDENGNVRITRMDFSHNSTFKDPWEISYPKADKSHLEKYTKDRSKVNTAPTISGEAVLDVTFSPTGAATSSITIPAGADDDLVHHYEITVKNDDTGVSSTYKFLSDFYRHSDPSTMAKTLTFPLEIKNEGNYTVEIAAVDSWDAKSNKITVKKSVVSNVPINAELPDVYADLEFENGTVTDKNGKLTVELVGGATVESPSLKFAGATKTQNALTVKKSGQYAMVTFKDYTKTSIANFYNSSTGYTIEALYVNRAPSGSQGIVCGTQSGGWGIAESAGVPYLTAYAGSSYIYARAVAKSSTTELTHAVATVQYSSAENKTYTALYLNGVLISSASGTGKLKISTIEAAHAFCLGSDLDGGSTGTDFPTTNFAITDVKIYDKALNYKQAETAYNNAVEAFAK